MRVQPDAGRPRTCHIRVPRAMRKGLLTALFPHQAASPETLPAPHRGSPPQLSPSLLPQAQ